MLNKKIVKKILLSTSFVLFLFSIFSYSSIYSETTMNIYNTTGNSTDAKGTLTIKINDTSNLDSIQKIISQKIDKKNLDITLTNKTGIPTT